MSARSDSLLPPYYPFPSTYVIDIYLPDAAPQAISSQHQPRTQDPAHTLETPHAFEAHTLALYHPHHHHLHHLLLLSFPALHPHPKP